MDKARLVLGVGLATLLQVSCSGGATAPSDTGGSSSGGTAITISSSGVTPMQITVSQGTRVRFTNADSLTHEMTSDPHPEHTDCVEINAIGFISPGQTKETGNLNIVRTCRYHDHNDPDNTKWQGRIVIQ